MALNGKINTTVFTDATSISNNPNNTPVKSLHIIELRKALDNLERYSVNVDNCGYTNCCQSCQDACTQCTDKCQACQNTCNQCTDACQTCQNSCNQCTDACQRCQNSCYCQSCETCESCQASQCGNCYGCGYGDCGCSGD